MYNLLLDKKAKKRTIEDKTMDKAKDKVAHTHSQDLRNFLSVNVWKKDRNDFL